MVNASRLRGVTAAVLTLASAVSCARGGTGVSSQYENGSGGSDPAVNTSSGSSGAGSIGTLLPSAADGGPGPFAQNTPTSHTTSCMQTTPACTSACKDFPATAVIDLHPDDGSAVTPMDAASHFTAPDGAGSGPCILEPQDGTIIPQNWLRPRIRIQPAAGQNLFQITLHADSEANDYVAYTTSKTWKMPNGHKAGTAGDWDTVRASIWGQDITVTVRAVNMNDPASVPTSSSVKFRIAPAGAGGAMIYWAAVGDKNGSSWLEGFNVGDENVSSVLTTSQVALQISRDQGGNLQTNNGTQQPGSVECIGCHAAIPDGVDGGVGTSVAFVDFYPWTGVVAEVDKDAGGAIPPWLSPSGAQTFSQPWIGLPTFSKTDWATGEHIAVASYGCPPSAAMTGWYPWSGSACSDQPSSGLAWFDLSSTAAPTISANSYNVGMGVLGGLGTTWGILARTGDTRGAEFANFSHDGKSIVYVSTNAGKDGRLATGTADLYTIPFAARKGGAATAVMGAADPTWSEFYPSYAPNDAFVAFNRAPSTETMYYNPHDEVFVVPAAGGTATRLAANDPPMCAGVSSPGITNSWPKWSPSVQTCTDGLTYYWLIFSSSRDGNVFNVANFKAPAPASPVPTSQLYLTAITIDKNNKIQTYPALYIWNQPATSAAFKSNQSNHTPIWEELAIPPPPPPAPPPQ